MMNSFELYVYILAFSLLTAAVLFITTQFEITVKEQIGFIVVSEFIILLLLGVIFVLNHFEAIFIK